jgi:hypothetical protein
MDYLTTSQIADYNNPMAFARTRETRIGQSDLGQAQKKTIRTKDIEESYRLILGAAKRLETLEGNLLTMLGLAQQGSGSSSNPRKTEEIYGKLRSLSAGFDQVVEAIRFDDQAIFTENKVRLSQGPGTRDLTFDPIRLLTYGENSLNLSESVETANIEVKYATDDIILNDYYKVIGLDIKEATYIKGSNPALELQTGTYKLGIEYAGADSAVEIRNQEGAVIERKTGVDLSGSGSEWVDFDSGVRLSFEMESLFKSFDKYDFAEKGPAKLTATLDYERIDQHILRTNDTPQKPNSVDFIYNSPFKIGATSLSLSEPKTAPVSTGVSPLKTGNYNLEVQYYGENSVAKLTDALGRITAYKFGVDLSANGKHEIDFGNGFSFNLENTDFDTNGTKFNSAVKFHRETEPLDDFDFRKYEERITAALAVIQEQNAVMTEAQSRVEKVNQLRNSASTSNMPNAAAFNGSSALSLLSGGSGGGGLFGQISSDARFGILSTQLFQTTTTFPSQDRSPEALSQLSANSNVGSILSTFA